MNPEIKYTGINCAAYQMSKKTAFKSHSFQRRRILWIEMKKKIFFEFVSMEFFFQFLCEILNVVHRIHLLTKHSSYSIGKKLAVSYVWTDRQTDMTDYIYIYIFGYGVIKI